MINITDQLAYLDHCRQKMIVAVREERWADAGEFAKGARLTLEELERIFTVEKLNK